MKKLVLLVLIVIIGISSCSNNSTGISKEEEEKIVRKETTQLAHFYVWKHKCNHFLNSDLWNMLNDFKNVPLHRWDFGDYSSSRANQFVIDCKEYAYETVWNTPNSKFELSYKQYMEKYYAPTKYHYVSDDELFLAEIFYAVYENSKPSACEIAVYIAGLFKINTPEPTITAIQRLKSKEEGYYWEVYYDNGELYRVKVIKKENGTWGINKSPVFY